MTMTSYSLGMMGQDACLYRLSDERGTNAVVPPAIGGISALAAAAAGSGSRRFTRARSCPCSYRSSQYDSVRRSRRLARRRALRSAPIATMTAAAVTSQWKVNKTRTISNGLQRCQPPDTIPPFLLHEPQAQDRLDRR